MNIFLMGGWMMWPLAFVSIMVTAIVIERFLFFFSFSFPDRGFTELLEKAADGDAVPLCKELEKNPMFCKYAHFLVRQGPNREASLQVEGESVLKKMEARLSLLSMLAKLAPLMGLLGTVFGMISTFSEIASASSGVNMNQLAGGIWQALITTAAGLCIAIPALFFLHVFQKRANDAADALAEAANVVLSLPEGNRHDFIQQKKKT
ncbi:MAG: MotA/TolQ/ExbB proton channel family protein [Mailhella sp.]|nr:MotA/TolQ/ExbB proton channel family protein [Mailhella sp.]